jgi:type I restriction enzyme M protein
VGVAEVEDDGVDFYERMMEIHLELNTLSAKASELMREINKSWEALA